MGDDYDQDDRIYAVYCNSMYMLRAYCHWLRKIKVAF